MWRFIPLVPGSRKSSSILRSSIDWLTIHQRDVEIDVNFLHKPRIIRNIEEFCSKLKTHVRVQLVPTVIISLPLEFIFSMVGQLSIIIWNDKIGNIFMILKLKTSEWKKKNTQNEQRDILVLYENSVWHWYT